jgi:hypothetical protein
VSGFARQGWLDFAECRLEANRYSARLYAPGTSSCSALANWRSIASAGQPYSFSRVDARVRKPWAVIWPCW